MVGLQGHHANSYANIMSIYTQNIVVIDDRCSYFIYATHLEIYKIRMEMGMPAVI